MRRALLAIALVAACGGGDGPQAPVGGDPDAGAPGEPDAAPPEPACEGPDACTADGDLARCVDGVVVVEDCGDGACHDGACVDASACAGVGPLGRCDGDTLWRCDGAVAVVDCAATGAVCAYVDDTTGYGCVDPATTGAHRVAGVVRWEDRALEPGALGPPVAVPARGTMVAIVDAADELIAIASTADDGSYVLHHDAPAGAEIRVVAYSRSRAAARPARVRDASGYLHALGSPTFAAGDPATVDLLVTASSTGGGAWNSLDSMIVAIDWLRAHGVAEIAPLYVYWQQGSATGSYYQGGTNSLYLDGGDGFDDVVALHEFGHYFQDEYSASDNPGGAHDGSPADPRLAWGEGGATWFAIALRGVPYYIDYATGGGWYVELEDRVHAASPTGAMSQLVSEWMVAEVMWDVSDGALDGDGDALTAGSASPVLDVLLGYLVDPDRLDRGRGGVDLVEWLDGWFLHDGTATCAPMRAVLDHHGFPYDFAGPTPCP